MHVCDVIMYLFSHHLALRSYFEYFYKECAKISTNTEADFLYKKCISSLEFRINVCKRRPDENNTVQRFL